jgi:hypothetical protein
MMNTIVVDSANGDAVAAHIAAVLSDRGGAEIVTLPEFLIGAGVWFDADNGTLIRDQGRCTERFEQTRSHRICNRVVSISDQTLVALGDQQYVSSTSLVFSHYAGLLQEFDHVWGTPGLYSPVGNLLPLNMQWRLFTERIHDIGTPRFVYGFGAEKVDVSDFHQPLWKSPFDLYTWKPAETINMPRFHPFVVDRPAGKPVILYFVGDAAEVFSLGPDYTVDGRTRAMLLKYASEIRSMFRAFIGEALFFVHEQELTFAGFSHYLKTSVENENLSKVLDQGLV